MQKNIYVIGAILGQGIIAGTGIKGGKGKFKMEDIVGQAIAAFLPRLFPQSKEQTETLINPLQDNL